MGIEAKDLLGVGKPLEIVTEGGVSFLGRIFGKPANELGELMGQELEFIRLNRRRVLERAAAMAAEAGAEPRRVPLNILVPLLQAAPLEEEPELQEAWAALLANAATGGASTPGFVDTLRQLSTLDAKVLQLIGDRIAGGALKPFRSFGEIWDVVRVARGYAEDPDRVDEDPAEEDGTGDALTLAIANLTRLDLVQELQVPNALKEGSGAPWFSLTVFGSAFLGACEAPKATKDRELP